MNLQLVKSDKFGETECDIYSDSKEMYMTIDQIATCLEYSNGRKGIENVIARNEYLKNEEFSVTLKLRDSTASTFPYIQMSGRTFLASRNTSAEI